VKYNQKIFLYPFSSDSPTEQTAHHIFTLDGSDDVNSCKGVPFLAFVDIAVHLEGKLSQNPNFEA